MDIPGRPVTKDKIADADMLSAGNVDEPSPHTARDCVFLLDTVCVLRSRESGFGKKRFLPRDRILHERPAAAADHTAAGDPDISRRDPALPVELADIEQGGIAHPLNSLEAAHNTRLIVRRIRRSQEDSALRDVQFHITVQIQRTGPENSAGYHYSASRRAVIDRPLDRAAVHGLPVPDGEIRRFRHIDLRPLLLCPDALFELPDRSSLMQKAYFHDVFTVRKEPFCRDMGHD